MKATGKIALDTNAVIAYRAGLTQVCDIIQKAERLFMPVIVLGELLYGAINSKNPEKNQEAIKTFLSHTILISVDENIAFRYSSLRLELKKKGRPAPENDLWIAAICLDFGLPLLTNDRHFENIDGLTIISWKEDKK